MKGMSVKGMLSLLKDLDEQEKKTFRIHILYQSIEGIILGVLALNEYVFLKSLQGTGYQLGFLFQASMLVFVFLVLFNELRKRIRNKKLLLRWAGLLTRLPLLALIAFPANAAAYQSSQFYHYLFLFIFLLYYFGNIIIYPAINVMLKTNYRHENFGKLYAYSTSLNKVIMLLATLYYGILLDQDYFAFRYVFPLVSVLGIISLFILSTIDTSRIVTVIPQKTLWNSFTSSMKGMMHILRVNKPYRDFEIGFMIYGLAFMMTSPIINIFLNDGLNLNYSSVAFYKNAYNLLAIILLLFTGKMLGKMDPRKFSAITFLSLGFYILFMMLAQYLPYSFQAGNVTVYWMLILSFLSYGYFAATMVLIWNIGSAYFCKPEEADDYQSNHLFLTGVRAIFAPILGVFFYEIMGFTGTFSLAIVLLLLASALMFRSYRVQRLVGG
jgi:hypothetical protein